MVILEEDVIGLFKYLLKQILDEPGGCGCLGRAGAKTGAQTAEGRMEKHQSGRPTIWQDFVPYISLNLYLAKLCVVF